MISPAEDKDTRPLMFDPQRFWPRRARPVDAPDLVARLALFPSGWEHAVFWISALVGGVLVVAAATDKIKNPGGVTAVLVLGLYFSIEGWRRSRDGASHHPRWMLLQGEAFFVLAAVALAIVAVRTLAR